MPITGCFGTQYQTSGIKHNTLLSTNPKNSILNENELSQKSLIVKKLNYVKNSYELLSSEKMQRKSEKPDIVPSLRVLVKNVTKDFKKYNVLDVLEFMGGVNELKGHAYSTAYIKGQSLLERIPYSEDKYHLTLSTVSDKLLKCLSNVKVKKEYDMFPSPVTNENRSGLIGVPVKGAYDPYSLPLEKDVDGNEIFYRKMSNDDYRSLVETGKLPATIETSISPAMAYSEKYNGILVRFALKKDTMKKFYDIGCANNTSAAEKIGSKIKVKKADPHWGQNHVAFKTEGKQMTLQLGRGAGLAIFNENIAYFTQMKERN